MLQNISLQHNVLHPGFLFVFSYFYHEKTWYFSFIAVWLILFKLIWCHPLLVSLGYPLYSIIRESPIWCLWWLHVHGVIGVSFVWRHLGIPRIASFGIPSYDNIGESPVWHHLCYPVMGIPSENCIFFLTFTRKTHGLLFSYRWWITIKGNIKFCNIAFSWKQL